jgi:hypothetical protein
MAAYSEFFRNVNPADPFILVDSPWGKIEQWRASTLALGTMGCLQTVYEHVKNDSAELQERELEHASRANAELTLARDVVAKIDSLTRRIDSLEATHKEAEAEQQRLDAQRELEDLEDIELPPGIEELGENTADDTPHPDGSLHTLPPSHDQDKEELAALEREDETDDGGIGDLPNELLETAPPSGGTMPEPNPAELAHPQKPPEQPVSVSLW